MNIDAVKQKDISTQIAYTNMSPNGQEKIVIGISISTRKPRSGDFTQIAPGQTGSVETGPVNVLISNAGSNPVYFKVRV